MIVENRVKRCIKHYTEQRDNLNNWTIVIAISLYYDPDDKNFELILVLDDQDYVLRIADIKTEEDIPDAMKQIYNALSEFISTLNSIHVDYRFYGLEFAHKYQKASSIPDNFISIISSIIEDYNNSIFKILG